MNTRSTLLAALLLAGPTLACAATPEDLVRPIQDQWAAIKYQQPADKQAESYDKLVGDHPASKLVANACFQHGESMARAGDLSKAEEVFLHLVEYYHDTPFAAEALLRIGEIRESQDRWLEAVNAYDRDWVSVYLHTT